ncbi:hypothetical protein SLS53_006040 [Cytospora paraplurivora]|uniref:Uncharacterized protein n=1 Tax=Cytospora paraplurivora TaxID=2898453 RepID=A0AAN9YF76_9PEZI
MNGDTMPKDVIADAGSDVEDLVPEGYKPPPIVEPETTPWHIDISDADFKKLQAGFRPADHDDKWFFLATGPDEAGITSIHIIRFFSHMVFYTLNIKPGDGGRFKIDSFTYERQVSVPKTEEEAKEHAVVLCRGHLECEFEALPEYDFFG